MNAIPYQTPDRERDAAEDAYELPGRPRRRLWGPWTALILALLVGVVGFYVGIRVEKGQVASSNGNISAASRGGGLGSQAGASSAGGGARRTGGFAGGFGRTLAGGGANASFGTVSSVNGSTIYLTDLTGNTVKVSLTSTTKVTKNLSAKRTSIRPGDTVIVSGLKGSRGTIAAATVTDSGARAGAAGGGGGSASGSGGSSSASSAVNSLFGSGGGG